MLFVVYKIFTYRSVIGGLRFAGYDKHRTGRNATAAGCVGGGISLAVELRDRPSPKITIPIDNRLTNPLRLHG